MPPPPVYRVEWRPAWRIVSSRFPPVGVFDAIAEPGDLEALYEIEGLTNPRLREEVGTISLVPRERRIAGPGTTPIMAAFTHPNPDGSRFSPAGHGVYYAALDRETAIRETVHHRNRFLARTREPRCQIQMRCYLGDLAGELHDIRGGWPELHDPHSYTASQRASAEWRAAGSNGVVFDSVRHVGGQCAAVFYPDLLGSVRQGPHLTYYWDGTRIEQIVIAEQAMAL